MDTGTVKVWMKSQGYGFILPDDGGEDLVVYRSSLNMGGIKDLTEGQRVSYDVFSGQKGKEASNVKQAQ